MHTIEIYQTGEVFEFPECIEELSEKQASAFFALVHDFKNGTITAEAFRIYLSIRLLDLKYNWRYERLDSDKKDFVGANIARIAELVDSFFEVQQVDGRPAKVLKLNFVKNIFPKLGKRYGPADALTDISFREYRDASDFYRNYALTGDEKWLRMALAVLWRKKRFCHWLLKLLPNYNGVVKRKYNPASVEADAQDFKSLDVSVLFGLKCFLESCFEFLQTGKPEINGSVIDLSKLYSQGEGKGDGLGLVGILYTVAETGIFGNAETVDNQNLYDILAMMYQAVMRNENLKEQYNNTRTNDFTF